MAEQIRHAMANAHAEVCEASTARRRRREKLQEHFLTCEADVPPQFRWSLATQPGPGDDTRKFAEEFLGGGLTAADAARVAGNSAYTTRGDLETALHNYMRGMSLLEGAAPQLSIRPALVATAAAFARAVAGGGDGTDCTPAAIAAAATAGAAGAAAAAGATTAACPAKKSGKDAGKKDAAKATAGAATVAALAAMTPLEAAVRGCVAAMWRDAEAAREGGGGGGMVARLKELMGTFLCNRSAALLGLGLVEEALADAERCIALQPSRAKPAVRCIEALLGAGRFDDAVTAAETAATAYPADAAVARIAARARTAATASDGDQSALHGAAWLRIRAAFESNGTDLEPSSPADDAVCVSGALFQAFLFGDEPAVAAWLDGEGPAARASLERVRAGPHRLPPTILASMGHGGDLLAKMAITSPPQGFLQHEAILCRLLAAGARPDARDRCGNTALHHLTGCHVGPGGVPVGMIQPLLDAGADLNAQNRNGQTPLHAAALVGNLETCKVLLDARARPDIADCNGVTAAIAAAPFPEVSGLLSRYQRSGDAGSGAAPANGGVDLPNIWSAVKVAAAAGFFASAPVSAPASAPAQRIIGSSDTGGGGGMSDVGGSVGAGSGDCDDGDIELVVDIRARLRREGRIRHRRRDQTRAEFAASERSFWESNGAVAASTGGGGDTELLPRGTEMFVSARAEQSRQQSLEPLVRGIEIAQGLRMTGNMAYHGNNAEAAVRHFTTGIVALEALVPQLRGRSPFAAADSGPGSESGAGSSGSGSGSGSGGGGPGIHFRFEDALWRNPKATAAAAAAVAVACRGGGCGSGAEGGGLTLAAAVMSLKEEFAGLLANRAGALLLLDLIPESIADAERAAAFLPDNSKAARWRVEGLMMAGRYGEALAGATAVAAAFPSDTYAGRLLDRCRHVAAFDGGCGDCDGEQHSLGAGEYKRSREDAAWYGRTLCEPPCNRLKALPPLLAAAYLGDRSGVAAWLRGEGPTARAALEKTRAPQFGVPAVTMCVWGQEISGTLAATPSGAKIAPPGYCPAHTVALKMLLDAGARPDARDFCGCTALMRAMESAGSAGSYAMAALLLAAGANPNAKDRSGATSLHGAVRLGNVNGCKLLLAQGASPDAVDSAGKTPIQAVPGASDDIVALLARHRARMAGALSIAALQTCAACGSSVIGAAAAGDVAASSDSAVRIGDGDSSIGGSAAANGSSGSAAATNWISSSALAANGNGGACDGDGSNGGRGAAAVVGNKKRMVCTGCRSVSYCSRVCQIRHWPKHKVVCKKTRELHLLKLIYVEQASTPRSWWPDDAGFFRGRGRGATSDGGASGSGDGAGGGNGDSGAAGPDKVDRHGGKVFPAKVLLQREGESGDAEILVYDKDQAFVCFVPRAPQPAAYDRLAAAVREQQELDVSGNDASEPKIGATEEQEVRAAWFMAHVPEDGVVVAHMHQVIDPQKW